MIRKTGTNRGDESVSAWTGCRVEVRAIEHTMLPPADLGHAWAFNAGGVLIVQETSEPLRTYDAMLEASAILRSAVALDTSRDSEVLAFVRRWGPIGAAHPRHVYLPPDQPPSAPVRHSFLRADGFEATRRVLREVGELARWLAAMQNSRWRSAHIPNASHIARGLRRQALRAGFARSLNAALYGHGTPDGAVRLYPQLGVSDGQVSVTRQVALNAGREQTSGFLPLLAAATVHEVLLVEIWRRAIDPNQHLRPCRQCAEFFVVSNTRANRVFCNDRCRFAYRERRRKAARRARDRGAGLAGRRL